MANKLYIQKDGERIALVDESEIPSKISDLTDDSNFINTSQTTGLIKNDGTIDTNTYLKDLTLINLKRDMSSNGIYFYVEPPLTLTVEGDNITFFQDNYVAQLNASGSAWLYGEGDIIVDWGDGLTDTIIKDESISHTYTDGLSSHDVTFHGQIDNIGTAAFAGCPISKAIIPNTIDSIGDASFCYSGVQDVIIRCRYIADNSFIGCESLENVEIDETVHIGAAFHNCSSLTSVSISSSVADMYESFSNSDYITDYQLYWTHYNIQYWDQDIMPVNENTVFTIPYGETQNYINHDYPEELLIERS